MNPAFAARHEFEMLYRIGDVRILRIDSGQFHRFVQHVPGGSDEGMPLAVFAVAGLLADEH
ncbi:MAG TPA: hypothetical protein VGF86_00225 [Candidatus Tumulicola sp.]|jgi:hypothetical protein